MWAQATQIPSSQGSWANPGLEMLVKENSKVRVAHDLLAQVSMLQSKYI